jgi:hypothetical protein
MRGGNTSPFSLRFLFFLNDEPTLVCLLVSWRKKLSEPPILAILDLFVVGCVYKS